MANLYTWEENGYVLGVVASEESYIQFSYLIKYSHTGVTVQGALCASLREAMLKGTLVPVQNYNEYQQFLSTCSNNGLWKLMADGTWINHDIYGMGLPA